MTRRARRPKPPKARVLERPTPQHPGLLVIEAAGKTGVYWWGPDAGAGDGAYGLRRAGTEVLYRVTFDDQGGRCSCPGHSHRGRCKHVTTLRPLHDNGDLRATRNSGEAV